MPTATDVATDLGAVVAWLRSWKYSEQDVLAGAKNECLAILMDTWQFLFNDERVPKRKVLDAELLAEQVKSIRPILEKWDTYGSNQRNVHLETIRDILSSAIAFFSA